MCYLHRTILRSCLLSVAALSLATSPMRQAMAEDTRKPEDRIKEQFPVLRNQSAAPLIPIVDETLSRVFSEQRFFVALFRQFPVARLAPEPLKTHNLFVVTKDGKVRHLTNTKGLEDFFRASLPLVRDEESAKDATEAWLRLSEEFKQDGFFKFSIPKNSLVVAKSNGGWKGSGKIIVTQGGKGEMDARLTFGTDGKLAKVEETNKIKPGVRPICQATKLLDSDSIVRRMAEQDILVMGRAAKEYLDEQRAKASPALKQAIDRLWQRIVQEDW
jgi:hypothetical protein